jgi:hypothetical protein
MGGRPFSRQQHDPRAPRDALRRRAGTDPATQKAPIGVGDVKPNAIHEWKARTFIGATLNGSTAVVKAIPRHDHTPRRGDDSDRFVEVCPAQPFVFPGDRNAGRRPSRSSWLPWARIGIRVIETHWSGGHRC